MLLQRSPLATMCSQTRSAGVSPRSYRSELPLDSRRHLQEPHAVALMLLAVVADEHSLLLENADVYSVFGQDAASADLGSQRSMSNAAAPPLRNALAACWSLGIRKQMHKAFLPAAA